MILSSSIPLTACGHNVPDREVVTAIRENYIVATPDESLRHCKDRPARPNTQSGPDISGLIINLDERGEDCASKLSRTWESIDEATARAARLNQPAD